MSRTTTLSILAGGALAAGLAGAQGGASMIGVSPGGPQEPLRIEQRCPTFSWAGVPGALGYELLVVAVPEGSETEATPRIHRQLAGAVSSWTPATGECLEPGGGYVWFVRPDLGAGQSAPWPEGLWFEVEARPSMAELEEALAVLQRYRDAAGDSLPQELAVPRPFGDLESSAPKRAGDATSRAAATREPELATRALETAVAAIRGRLQTDTGEIYGVVGITQSPDGAGLAAENTAGGPDLLLAGDPPGYLSEGGFSRESAADLAFDFVNPGTGSLSVRVPGGEVEAALFVGDGSGLTNLPVGVEGAGVATRLAFWSDESELGSNSALFWDDANLRLGIRTAAPVEALTVAGDQATLELGAEVVGKEENAGKIGYQRFTSNALDIVGAGTSNSNRRIKFFSEGGAEFTGRIDLAGDLAPGGRIVLAETSSDGLVGAIWRSGNRFLHTRGSSNTFLGIDAGHFSLTGSDNTGVGEAALTSLTTGLSNTGLGAGALSSNQGGSQNTAVGRQALQNNISGQGNIAIGFSAGSNVTGSNNILVGNFGGASESGVIRIGGAAHTQTFIQGINGVAVGASDPVLVNNAGQLGTSSASSARFKEEIEELGAASEPVHRLRPVTFRYRVDFEEGPRPLQYGLIAEEVAEVLPELVTLDPEGRPASVRYHVLVPLLLNEVQRQRQELAAIRELEAQQTSVRRDLEERILSLEIQLAALRELLGE